MTRVAIVKTRAMVAGEVAASVGAEAWESRQLAHLSARTLRRLAARVVDGFVAVHHEDLAE